MKHVKVVKRDERSRHAARQAEASNISKGEAKNPEREMAAIISQWITEFRDKQRADSQRMAATLFGLPTTAARP